MEIKLFKTTKISPTMITEILILSKTNNKYFQIDTQMSKQIDHKCKGLKKYILVHRQKYPKIIVSILIQILLSNKDPKKLLEDKTRFQIKK